MRSDIERWNEKYSKQETSPAITPDPLLIQYKHLFKDKCYALDVACGLGDNALYLAQLGCLSFAVDGSLIGIQRAKRRAQKINLRLYAYVADLDACALPKNAFDILVVIRYLNRKLIPAIKNAMTPNGVLVYKTFNHNFLSHKPTFPKEYVLDNGELSAWFNNWECYATNDDQWNNDSQTYWVGKNHEPNLRSA